jgi:peptidoglycan/xylan/chitin deacetylase (PgdA/CDA1 family)
MSPPRTSPVLRAVLLLLALAELVFSAWQWCHPPIGVLLFHDLAEPRSARDFWTVPPDTFRAILDRLGALGLRCLDEEGLAACRSSWRGWPRSCLLTFDDGSRSHLQIAAPELARRGLPGVFFVVAGRLGLPRMSAPEVRQLAGLGFSIGSHSETHASLVQGPGEPAWQFLRRLAAEIAGSRGHLASLVGRPIRSFAYPGGEMSAEARALVSAAGYDNGFTTELGYVTAWSDPAALPRNLLFRDATPDSVEDWLMAPTRWLALRLALDNLVLVLLVASFALRGRPASGLLLPISFARRDDFGPVSKRFNR